MNTFLTIGGLKILDVWLNDSRTPTIIEKSVLISKSATATQQQQPQPDSNTTSKRGRGRPGKNQQQVEEDQYEIQKEYVISETGPLLLTILLVLADISLND